jgi:hypothetical protein
MALAGTAWLAGCAGSKGPAETAKYKIENFRTFDLASCQARPIDIAPNPEGITAGLLSVGPALHECFVDPASRAGGEVNAHLKATLGAPPTFEVTGAGVSEAGKACLIAAAKRLTWPAPAEGAPPASGEIRVSPNGPPVEFGKNVASDAVATIRLATSSVCECLLDLGTAPAPYVTAQVVLSATAPAAVTVLPASNAAGPCLTKKLLALALPKEPVQFEYQFLFMNSRARATTDAAPATLQNLQWEGIREQAVADVTAVSGKRVDLATKYVALAKSFNARPDMKRYPDVRAKCLELVDTDGAWVEALGWLSTVGEKSLALVRAEKAKDAATWAPLEERLTSVTATYNQERDRVTQLKDADLKTCPKAIKK